MKYFRLAPAVASLMLSGGNAFAALPDECPKIWRQDRFKAAGGILTVVVQPNLKGLPKSEGAGILHVVVKSDGRVFLPGWDASHGLEATAAVDSRVVLMRYAPPRLKGKPVCVGFDFKWSSEAPTILKKEFSTEWGP